MSMGSRRMALSLILSLAVMPLSPVQAEIAASSQSAATRPVATTRSAAEVGAFLKQMKEKKKAMAKVAHIDLSQPLSERPADFSLFGDETQLTHYSLLKRLQEAARDKSLAGVLLTVRSETLSLAQAQEVRDALIAIGKAGKKTFVYADSYSSATYIVATGASQICLLPGGEIEMPGVAVETLFAKGLLDKLGIQADFIQIGDYKGAAESMTRTSASPELKGEMNGLVEGLYGQLIEGICVRRGVSEKQARQLIDQALIPADAAKEAGLVDQVVDIDGMRALMAESTGKTVDVVANYGKDQREEIDLSNPFAFLQMISRKPTVSDEPAVGLVYVDGMIVEGDGGSSVLGGSVASDGAIRKAMRLAARDPDIKAIVIRIDSPGGSALASEAAWQAIRRVAKEKPVIISVGHMAASGGYYIACAGDRIFADPSAIVGSIGVVGGKLAMGGLYEKLGLTTETFSRGANADLFGSAQPFTDNQRVMVKNLMKQTYSQFKDRILTTRREKIADIEEVAQGRIFIAANALKLGLVDELGGLEKALAYAASKGGLGEGFEVRVLPSPKTLADVLSGGAETRLPVKSLQAGMSPELMVLPESVRNAVEYQLLAAEQLDHRPVILLPPTLVRVR